MVSSTLILRRFFFAASMPFLIAAGTSLALPVPKPTIFAPGIAHDHQSRKAQVLTALDDLGHAVDRDHLFLQVQVIGLDALRLLLLPFVRTPVLLRAPHRPGP